MGLPEIQERIARAARAAGRRPDDIALIAVSKMQPEDRIAAVLAAGHRLFGENRVQEAESRWIKRRDRYPDLELHLIGPLQTNKVKEAVALFGMIQSLDRPKLAAALAREMDKQNRRLPCLIQVNTGHEDQKSGIAPEQLGAFLRECRETYGLDIRGLMCIPPLDEPPALHFALLKTLADALELPELSMGMSSDYEKAIPLGSTYLRIGSAFFGERREF